MLVRRQVLAVPIRQHGDDLMTPEIITIKLNSTGSLVGASVRDSEGNLAPLDKNGTRGLLEALGGTELAKLHKLVSEQLEIRNGTKKKGWFKWR